MSTTISFSVVDFFTTFNKAFQSLSPMRFHVLDVREHLKVAYSVIEFISVAVMDVASGGDFSVMMLPDVSVNKLVPLFQVSV